MSKLEHIALIAADRRNYESQTVKALIRHGAHTATCIISEKMVVRATLVLGGGKLPRRDSTRIEIVLTIGTPNYDTRQYIKACKKAGEPFPIKKVWLQFPPDPVRSRRAKQVAARRKAKR